MKKESKLVNIHGVMMWELFFSKKEGKLEIRPLSASFRRGCEKWFARVTQEEDTIVFNDCYIFGGQFGVREAALKMKDAWVNEAGIRLDLVMAIKI